MVPVPSLIIDDVIMTSLLSLNILNVLANFMFIRDLSISVFFALCGYF